MDVSNQTQPSLSPTLRPGALHPSMRNSGIVNNVDAQTYTAEEMLFIEGCLDQADAALEWAELSFEAVAEAVALLD